MKDHERLLRRFGRVYRTDAFVFREGELGREMYYVLSGRIRVEKCTGPIRKILTEMGPGEYFGEMALLADMPRTASAVAVEDSIIAVIDEETFHRLLLQSTGVSLLFLREFSHRLKNTTEALEDLSGEWMKLFTILYFMREWPFPSCEAALADLARRTGREVPEIGEILSELEREGVIETREGEVTAFHPDRTGRYLDPRGKNG